MDDLIAWLRAQLDDVERVAREVLSLEADDTTYAYSWSRTSRLNSTGIGGTMSLPGAPTPRERLAEVDAQRQILELHPWANLLSAPASCMTCAAVPGPCVTLRILALPYADRPGYRDEWRPSA